MIRSFILTCVFGLLLTITLTADNASLSGHVKDVKTGEALWGASIVLPGEGKGAATDVNGAYTIANLKPGKYKIRVTYIGYNTIETEVKIRDGANKYDVSMNAITIMGQEVVVTAQVGGQKQAINKELTADQISNVVSKAEIKELPDANAAESVGRLPGVNVIRSGGEGFQVTIRGLQPKYNVVTIDGVSMAASDANDRGTDLSVISSNALDGIEVMKTVTPDMDAAVLGGVVNFDMHTAQVKEPGKPVFNLELQGGYNDLPDAKNKYNNYKYILSAENRFLDDDLGVFAQFNVDRRNLTSNQLSATYDHKGDSKIDYVTTGLSLFYLPRDRQRYNGALNLDYKLPDGKIKLINFLSYSSTTCTQAENTYTILKGNASQTYQMLNLDSKVRNYLNSFDLEYEFPYFIMNAKISHTYSETENPDNWKISFGQESTGMKQFVDHTDLSPKSIPLSANTNFSQAYLMTVTNNSSISKQRVFGGSLDFTGNMDITSAIAAKIKLGGKYEHQKRSYDYDQYNSIPLTTSPCVSIDDEICSRYSIPAYGTCQIPMSAFIDPAFNYGKFFGGDYPMYAPLKYSMASDLAGFMKQLYRDKLAQSQNPNYYHNLHASAITDYTGNEDRSAVYAMSTFSIGTEITMIAGLRYQNLRTSYNAIRGNLTSQGDIKGYNHYDTTVTKNNAYLLPHISIRYKPIDWFDLRLSYTNTVAYPDFNQVIPKIDLNFKVIDWGNYTLKPSLSENFDIYASVYHNSIGLFTVGAFLKKIDNLIYPWSFYAKGSKVLGYMPYGTSFALDTVGTYNITTYVNNSYRVNDYGMELDWRTHFWYLPEPFSGIVLNVNFTHIFSKAQYPYTYKADGRVVKIIDTSFVDRLVYQPDNILNISLGYDYLDFSVRVSMVYQSDIFTGPNFWPQLKAHTASYKRWDVAAKQSLPWFGVQVFADVNNISSAHDISVIQKGEVPLAEQDYGLTANLGFRVQF